MSCNRIFSAEEHTPRQFRRRSFQSNQVGGVARVKRPGRAESGGLPSFNKMKAALSLSQIPTNARAQPGTPWWSILSLQRKLV